MVAKLFHLQPSSHLGFFSLVCSQTGSETEVGVSEEIALTRSDVAPTESGPSGLVIFGRLVQKHSYVSGLIIMMVRNPAGK